MILSEHARRWAEVRLYQFCLDMYKIRNKSIDIIDFADLISGIGNINQKQIRYAIQKMLNDTYFQPTKRDIILLAHLNGFTGAQIAGYVGITRQGVNKYVRDNLEDYTPIPRFQIDEDNEIVKFIETLDKIELVGNIKHGSIN